MQEQIVTFIYLQVEKFIPKTLTVHCTIPKQSEWQKLWTVQVVNKCIVDLEIEIACQGLKLIHGTSCIAWKISFSSSKEIVAIHVFSTKYVIGRDPLGPTSMLVDSISYIFCSKTDTLSILININ
jgi:hypothetical protein